MTGPWPVRIPDLYAEIMLERYPELLAAGVGRREECRGPQEPLSALYVPAAISGRALLDGEITDSEVASFRQSA